jgi:hypothetical protein
MPDVSHLRQAAQLQADWTRANVLLLLLALATLLLLLLLLVLMPRWLPLHSSTLLLLLLLLLPHCSAVPSCSPASSAHIAVLSSACRLCSTAEASLQHDSSIENSCCACCAAPGLPTSPAAAPAQHSSSTLLQKLPVGGGLKPLQTKWSSATATCRRTASSSALQVSCGC